MEYILRCVQNKRLFEVYKRSVYVRNDCTCDFIRELYALSEKSDNATYREDYIIVLGAGLKGDTPSLALERRLEKSG